MHVHASAHVSHVVTCCSVEVQADVTSSLENPKPIPTQYSQMLDLLEESMSEDVKATPQPFSQRKSMYSACDMAGKVGGPHTTVM